VARILEARLAPPYEGASGLGTRNAPGLGRLAGASFTGEYPLARIGFRDARLPVKVALEAFTPMIPLDAEESGLPVAVLRYRVANPGAARARVSVAFVLDNPVGTGEARRNEFRDGKDLAGYLLTNPSLAADAPANGSFALCVRGVGDGRLTHLDGWPKARWWASPLLFWDDFSADGALGPQAEQTNRVASLCLSREIAPGAQADFEFLLAWHFPNRTPAWCGWTAPKGEENAIIGNHYAQRFSDAWAAAAHASANLPSLEARMGRFLAAMRETTLPAAVKEAAMSNLSTLATPTCFRTADGRFRGFEGINDHTGCCFGSCNHVWNYESATHHLFPALARSMREAAFELSGRLNGLMPIRGQLPEGKQTGGIAAADGQMGQIIKAYLDWRLSGDGEWLRKLWPEIKRALEFAWVEGGWDADRDGVMEGVQHNTYDVEFFGPNPMCGIYYLGALRAGEEMARAMGDPAAAVYRGLFEKGRAWIDANLFNGEYYIQKVRGVAKERIARDLLSTFGSDSTEKPDFQLGEGCLVDQLVGQYVADFAGLGPLVDPAKIRKTLESIYKYNYKRELFEHESVQRIFALNDEAALVICDYGRGKRPRVPFPYFAEVMTGFEYSAAVLMLWHGMVDQGIECIANIRRRYDGERRNPWDEAECGHHYARAMAAWSAVLALSGFRYHGRVDSSLPARQLPLVLVHGHRMGEFHPQRAERRTEPENRRGRGPPRSAQHRHRCAGRIGSIQSPRHPRRSRDNRARNAETGPLAPRLGQRLSSGTEGWGRHRAGPAILEQRTLKRPSLRRGSKTASTPRNRTSGSRFATLASINWIARSEWPSPVSTMAA
jgi:uncharacterized protein (DUF608 family)